MPEVRPEDCPGLFELGGFEQKGWITHWDVIRVEKEYAFEMLWLIVCLWRLGQLSHEMKSAGQNILRKMLKRSDCFVGVFHLIWSESNLDLGSEQPKISRRTRMVAKAHGTNLV